MVYRGKVAPGCALCRKRRLLCDLRRPSCSQCLRVHQECTGYQDPKSLRFYDQTKEVSRKVRGQPPVAPKSKSTSPASEKQQAFSAAIFPPPISNNDRAMRHFFTYYVGTNQKQGMYWYLPPLLQTTSSAALQAATKALGLVSMAAMEMMPNLMHSALGEYGIALHATNQALRDPTLVTSDSTLAAVALLSTYEMVSCQISNVRLNWLNHIQGGTRLLELRGEEQLNSEFGMQLFTTMRLLHAVSGIFFGYSKHHSPKIAELSTLAKAKRDANSLPIETLYDLLIRLDYLSIQMAEAGESTENLGPLIAEALRLDADLKSWPMSLSHVWHYTVVNAPPHAQCDKIGYFPIHGDIYHMYPNLSIAGIWNFYRQARIIINEMIRSMTLRSHQLQQTSEGEQIRSQSTAVIDQMVDDICASINFYIVLGAPGLAAVIRLQWALFISALCTDKNSARYRWILKTIDMIAQIGGFRTVITMSQRLRIGATSGIIPGVR